MRKSLQKKHRNRQELQNNDNNHTITIAKKNQKDITASNRKPCPHIANSRLRNTVSYQKFYTALSSGYFKPIYTDMIMHAPPGSVPGLCTTASAFLATGSALMAYITQSTEEYFTTLEMIAIFTMLIALFFIGRVPWIITKPMDDEISVNLQPARKSLATGTILFFIALGSHAANGIIIEPPILNAKSTEPAKINTQGK